MKTSTFDGEYRIQWKTWIQLDYLDFVDDLVLLSHTHERMQAKTTTVAKASESVGPQHAHGESQDLQIPHRGH
ncbi:unnamed protein product [Schistosoma margrebowiei]|uniref:Uncharacterized protein n=1 Tax=Schistosoma margrebowiei TaxID=48269 RepID=A0A183MTK6_9TREM|nr:unnamed protein product [Schistosoma margrebowiei]